MKDQAAVSNTTKEHEASNFEYKNEGWPRDFDIRIEVAEQREVLEQSI